jgi:hypothetical protein
VWTQVLIINNPDIGINSPDSPRSNEDNIDLNSVKIPLSFIFNTVIEQSNKIEKWKTKNLISIYDNYTIFQSKINKSIFSHYVCDSKKFNYEIVKEITSEITEKLNKIEGELENLSQSNENI